MVALPIGYKNGKSRPFLSTFRASLVLAKSSITKLDNLFLFILFASSILVRFYGIRLPGVVVSGEDRVGSLVREYAYGDFFIDLDPPLVKLAYFFIACVSQGWDADFDFAIVGEAYPEAVPYVYMRVFSAACGVLTVMLTYGILRASGCRSVVALVGSTLVCIENSMVTQSRLILLESPLLLGIALSLFAYNKFKLTVPFSQKWFKFLVLTGIGLGVTISLKWEGMFTMLTILFLALVVDMWFIIGDLELTKVTVAKHAVYRLVFLIAVPLVIYLGLFATHLGLLPHDLLDAGLLSPDFKLTLREISGYVPWNEKPSQVSYGATITLKHYELGGYLHSHDYTYRSGTFKQQVTLLGSDPDFSNEWIVEMKQRLHPGELDRKVRPIKEGDTIRLLHRATGKFLHVDDIRPPISEQTYNNEVNCEGESGMDPHDANYEWTVRIVGKRDEKASKIPMLKLRSSELVFQLVHRGTGCILYSHEDKLPAWAHGQMEVMCVEEPTIPNTFWYIESNQHPQLSGSDEERIHLKEYTLWDKVRELHQVMSLKATKILCGNNPTATLPESWTFLAKGMSYVSGESEQVYLLGNFAIYVIGFFIVSLIISKQIFYYSQISNPFSFATDLSLDTIIFHSSSFVFLTGWTLNYFPYFGTKRNTFLYQYLPAVYFSILLISQYLEYQMSKRKWLSSLLIVLILGLSIYCYITFIPLIYGTEWTREQCLQSKWFYGWDYDCQNFK